MSEVMEGHRQGCTWQSTPYLVSSKTELSMFGFLLSAGSFISSGKLRMPHTFAHILTSSLSEPKLTGAQTSLVKLLFDN